MSNPGPSSPSLADRRRKAFTLLKVYYDYMLEYRAEILLWALSNLLPLIMMGIWMEAGRDGRFNMQPVEFARYFLCIFIIRQFTVVWVIWEFEYHVVQGKLSPLLLHPIDPAWRFLAGHIAERLTRLPFSIGFIALFFTLYPEAIWFPDPIAAGFACLLTMTAFFFRFLLQYTFSMFAFWVERVSAIEHFFWLPYLFLSGLTIPLNLYPPAVQEFIFLTPFPYLAYYPAAWLTGWPVPVSIGQAMLVMGGWMAGTYLVNRILWKTGLKQYSAMGA